MSLNQKMKFKNKIGRKVKLREVSSLITKGTTPTTIGGNFVSKGINFIKAESITDDGCFIKRKFDHIDEKTNQLLKRSIVFENDILYSIAGVIGRSAIVTKEILPANTNQALAIIRLDKNQADPKYIFYALSTTKQRSLANSFVAQSVQANINLRQVGDFEIFLSEIDDQKRIADILSAFDDKIELNNKISRTLERMAQAIFKEWFVKFRFPGYEKVKIVDSELGKIPEGWRIGNLGILGEFQNGFAFYKIGYSDKGMKVVDLINVDSVGNFRETERDKFVSETVYCNPKFKKFIFKKNDLVMIMTDITQEMGILGKTGRIYENDKFMQNQRIGRIRVHPSIDVNFVQAYLNSKIIISKLQSMALGSVQKYVNTNHIKELNFVLPEKSILKQYSEITEPIFSNIRKNNLENQKLVALRDLLLPKLMSGGIRV